MIRLLLALPLLFLLAMPVIAAPTLPTKVVSATPENVRAGSTVTLEAFVYNETAKTVSVDVLFATSVDEIETILLTIPAQSAKTASTEWTVPKEEAIVTASVVKAVDANKRNVPELLGVIGTVTVGSTSSFSIAGLSVGVKTWFGKVFSDLEPWREEQAEHFTNLRNQKREELGISNMKDITKAPKPTEGGAMPEDAENLGDLAPKNSFPIESYATLMYASALSSLFSSAALFYVTGILLILFLLRLFFRLFS